MQDVMHGAGLVPVAEAITERQDGRVYTTPVPGPLMAGPGGKPGQGYPTVMVGEAQWWDGSGVASMLTTNSNASRRNTAMVAYPVDSSVSYAAPAIGTLVSSDVAGTLMRNNGAGSGETENAAYIQSGMAVRRLTPVECERLMGFSDGHTRIPWRKKPASECPDGPRYKALGNSMAVNCMRFIGERIALVDAVFSELDAAAQTEGEVP